MSFEALTHSQFQQHPITVMLVDDQAMIGEAVRRMLEHDKDITLHYCSDPAQAIPMANRICPTVILQDLVMPEVDGMSLVKFYRANPATRQVPVIVLSSKEEPKIKAESFAVGANDYLVKLPDKIELVARIRHHSRGYINLLERDEAYEALLNSQKALAAELAEAAEYVCSLLPPPITSGNITTKSIFVPSTSLGGDAFGHHWIDDDHFAIYLLDVCGHGVGAALLSVSAMETLRSGNLPNANFHDPASVLADLNIVYDMEAHNFMYFTIWYGVYQASTHTLVYASGGHPAALLMTGADRANATIHQLATSGGIIGGMQQMKFTNGEIQLQKHSRLYVYSDGVYEITRPDGSMWSFEQFTDHLHRDSARHDFKIQDMHTFVRQLGNTETLDDDFSLLEIQFAPKP